MCTAPGDRLSVDPLAVIELRWYAGGRSGARVSGGRQREALPAEQANGEIHPWRLLAVRAPTMGPDLEAGAPAAFAIARSEDDRRGVCVSHSLQGRGVYPVEAEGRLQFPRCPCQVREREIRVKLMRAGSP